MNPLYARRRLLGRNVYKKTVEGNPAIAQGSLARRYPGITMQGWTEQAQYEGKNLFDISDFETNNKGIIENGTILFKQSLGTVMYYLSLSPGTYSISIKRSGYSGINIKVNEVAVINNGGGNNFTNNFDVSDGDSVVLEFLEGQNPNGEDRIIYDIMLNSGSTALPYEPYTGGKPSPSPEYPQPITSAGKYNEETQKWEYEITIANEQTDPDKNQTVALTADRPLTKWDRLEKRNGQWGWVYKSAEIESYTDESVPGEYYSTTGQLSTGAQVWYETATETFAPLSESEREAMNALYTFRPTTVLSNDCECNMSLTYKTKKSSQPVSGGGIRKPSGVTSYFTFGVKWNQVNKIVFKISGVTEKQNMFLCGSGTTPYIAVGNEYLYPMLNSFSASIPVEEVLDGAYHEIVFTFSTPLLNSSIVNIWDEMWSKTIIYHEIAFYNGDDLLADYVPYYKGAGYMLDKKNNVVIRATNPEDYQFA